MFMVYVGSKLVEFRIVCSLQPIVNINTIEADPHSDSQNNGIVKPKNRRSYLHTAIGGLLGEAHPIL